MVIKIKKENDSRKFVEYKSTKTIITPKDVKDADRLDRALDQEIQTIEKILLKRGMLSGKNRKHHMLETWYLIGTRINDFLKKFKILAEEENIFWNHLYGRSILITKKIPQNNISKTRNDFRIASLLARHPIMKLKKVGPWALWREIITYRAFKDERVLNWVIQKLIASAPKTRNDARPFLKSASERLKRIDTSVLNDKELKKKLISTLPKSKK